MSVDFYLYRPDIPADCLYELATDWEDWNPEAIGFGEAVVVRVKVAYLYDDRLCEKYPALYSDYFDGKRCRQVTYRLGVALRNVRAHELRRFPPDVRVRASRMLSGMSCVMHVCMDHPDWKIRTES